MARLQHGFRLVQPAWSSPHKNTWTDIIGAHSRRRVGLDTRLLNNPEKLGKAHSALRVRAQHRLSDPAVLHQ